MSLGRGANSAEGACSVIYGMSNVKCMSFMIEAKQFLFYLNQSIILEIRNKKNLLLFITSIINLNMH